MRAPCPAARSAHSFFKFTTHSFDMLTPGFRLLHRDGPADPFVASKRGDVFPLRQRRGIRNKCLAQIRR